MRWTCSLAAVHWCVLFDTDWRVPKATFHSRQYRGRRWVENLASFLAASAAASAGQLAVPVALCRLPSRDWRRGGAAACWCAAERRPADRDRYCPGQAAPLCRRPERAQNDQWPAGGPTHRPPSALPSPSAALYANHSPGHRQRPAATQCRSCRS